MESARRLLILIVFCLGFYGWLWLAMALTP